MEHAMVEVQSPNRLWRAIGAVTAVALSFGLGSPTAEAGTDAQGFDQRGTPFALSTVVETIEKRCQTTDVLEVTVQEPTRELSLQIDCVNARTDAYSAIQKPLVDAASRVKDAGKRANRSIELQDSLPPTEGVGSYDRDQLVWSFAASNGMACRRAESQKQIQEQMSAAAQNNGETPEKWTRIETTFIAGACPDKLPDLFDNVAALGNPTAANTIRELVDRKPVTLPLESVPEGVSARSVDSRPVFLKRDGNKVTTFIADPHHLPDGRELWWCPKEEIFIAPTYGEGFNPDGSIANGPPPRGLDRFKTDVHGDTVTVHLKDLVRGSTTRHDRDLTMPEAQADPQNWNTSPDNFCFQAIKNQ